MQMQRKMATILLLSVAMTLLGATTLQSLVRSQPPAACHEHSHPAHSPEPVNHLCCGVGHQVAILQEPAKLQPCLACVSLVAERAELLIAPHSAESFSNPLISASFEPILVFLRI